jgi:small subunit ribosomal protein S16
VALKIKFSRTGRKNTPFFRIVVAEEHSRRDGTPVALLGRYNPREADNAKKLEVDDEKLKYWVSVGAKPTEKAKSILKTHLAKS